MKFNQENLVAMFDGDEDIFVEIRDDFVSTYPEMVEAVVEAAKNQDHEKLHISAHTMKGVLATFCADELREVAFEIEMMGKDNNLARSVERAEFLAKEIEALIEELKSFDTTKMAA